MANSSPIQQLYVAFFQRPADPAGLAYWTSVLNSGASLASIAQAFAGSAEFAATIAGKPEGDIVDAVYQGLFGRPADPAGLQYWRPLLVQGGLSSMAGFVLSVLGGAQGQDQQALDNRVLVADQFTTTVNGSASYNSAQDIANARDFLKGVTAFSGSIPIQAQITSFIQTRIADPGDSLYVTPQTPTPASGQTYTLTAGADTVNGGEAGDTIVGTVAGSLATGDNINGGGGTDTLTVTDASNINTSGTTVVNVEVASLSSSGTITANTTGWTGLNSLALSAVGMVTVTAGAQALSITETGAGQLAANLTANGGSTVTIVSNHNTGGGGTGLITVGATTQPTGAINISSSVDAANRGGTITVSGGTTVTVTQAATNAAGTNVTEGSWVTVNGGASTTSVTVTQPTAAEGASAVTAITGVAGVAGVSSAPGTQPVAAVTGVTAVAARAAVAGVLANGAVEITDSKYNTASTNSISTVALSNYGSGSFISSNQLTNLSLSGTASTLRLKNATSGTGTTPTANNTLALTLNGLSGDSTVTDVNNEITTLNVTTTGADSTLAAFADTGLTTLTVAGSKVLTLGNINTSLTSIAVSGAAGFNDGGSTAANGFAALGGGATFTTTSSGPISLSLDSTSQGFVGSTGVDTIRITPQGDAAQTITGGSSTSDELILEGSAYALSSFTSAMVSGFEILGVASNVTGTVHVADLGSTFNKLHIFGGGTVVFDRVANNTTLVIDAGSNNVLVKLIDSNGPTDTVGLTLGTANSANVSFGSVVFRDSTGSTGIGTVNLVSNGVDISNGSSSANKNSVALGDNSLSTMNLSGTQGLVINTLNEAATPATSITLNNTNTSSFGLLIGTLTDNSLNSLAFTGNGKSVITKLTDSTATSLTISNTGSQLATVGTFTSSAALTNLTLTGNVQIGDGLVGGTGLTTTATTGITVSGATDHAHVKLSIGAAAAGLTNSVTLGNGNNVVIDATIAGTSNVSLGTGSNFLTIGGATTNTTGAFNITLGAHTAGSGSDYITVGTGGTAYATVANYTITGAAVGDRIIFNTDAAATLVGHTASVITATTPGVSEALTISALQTAVDALAAHGVAYAVFGGDTYLAESISSTLGGTDTTIVKITGVHTLEASTTSGYVVVTA